MKKRYSLLFSFLFFSLAGHAQDHLLDVQREWLSLKNIDLYTGQILPDTFQVKIDRNVLTLTNRGLTKDFQINNLTGTWVNIADQGALNFNITIKGITGEGELRREGTELSVVVDLSTRKNGMKRKFIITE